MVEWSHREPSYLRLALQGNPRIVGRGDPYLPRGDRRRSFAARAP
jgi:hypothetical protein